MGQQLDDLAHIWGNDLQVSPAGDFARVNGLERSKQRVMRRLLTNPGDYKQHPTYGAGLAAYVGQVLNIAKLTALVRGQMLLEASVGRSPEPVVNLVQIPNGIEVDISYTALPDRQPVLLSFTVSP
jgi:hypothetical protein